MALAIHNTAAAENSGAESNAHFTIKVISSEQLLQNNRNSLIPLPHAVRNIRNPSPFVTAYYTNSHQIVEFFTALAERLSTRIYIHEATPRGAKDALMACVFFLTQEMLELARATEHQSRIQATLQSIDDALGVKLGCINAWKKVSVTFFTLAAATSAAGAVTAVNLNPKRIAAAAAAAATAATVLIGAVGNWIHSLLKKPESAAKRNREIIRAMVRGAEIITTNLIQVYDLASDLKSETEAIWKMVDDGATDVAVREKVLALNNSFQNLQRKARSSSSEVRRAREAVLQSIIRNTD